MSNFDIALGILLIAEYRPVLNRLRNVDILLDSCNHGILSFLGIVLFFVLEQSVMIMMKVLHL